MYKKINTTRNSSFKKASIFIAVAAFASCAVFFGTERFNYNGEEASSVYANFRSNKWYGGRGKRGILGLGSKYGRYGRPYSFRDDRSLSDLTNDQKANFDAVVKEAKLIIEQMRDRLTNLKDIPDRINSLGVDGLGNIPNRVAQYIFEEAEVFRKLDSPQDNPYSVDDLFGSMKDCLQRLRDCQNYLLEVIQSMGTLLELDRIKDADKIEELKNSDLGQLIKCPDELIDLAGIEKIKSNGSSSVDKAKDIIGKALKAFVNVTTFEETKQDDPWATNWMARYKDHSCYKLIATLQTLLYINQQINSINKYVITSEIVGNFRQAFRAVFDSFGSSINATAAEGKYWFFEEFTTNGRMDLLLMPLLLATAAKNSNSSTKAFKGVEFEGSDKIKDISKKLVEQMADASRSRRQLRDLIRVANELANDTVNKAQREDIKIDLKDLLVNAVGSQAAKEQLKQLDDVILGIFSQGKQTELERQVREEIVDFMDDPQYPDGYREATAADKIKIIVERLQSGAEKYRFVGTGGNLNSATLKITSAQQVYFELAKGAATVLSVPEYIRNTALVKLIIDKYNYNYNSTAILDNNPNSWFSITRFNSAVSEEVGKIQSIYSDSKKAIDKVSQVKSKEKSTQKTKKESSESKSGRSITNMLLLDAANRNSNSLAIKAQGKTIEVSNLPSDAKKLSPVLCPKVSPNSKEGDKNIDLPLVDVVDGKATIDLTSQLNAAGNYELHFRNAKLDPATQNVKEYEFVRKSKFAYAADKTKPQSMCKITVEQADDSYLDFSTAEAILNEDKSVTYRVKAKSAASSNPEIMTGVCFKSDTKPNMEKDKFALQLAADKQTYSFTTNKGLEGNVELHIYNGEVETANYDGKIVAKTAETTEIESKEGTSIYSIIDKNPSSTSSAADGFTKRTVKFVISEDYLDDILDPNSNYFDYEILDSSGKVVCTGTTDRSRKSTKNRGRDKVYQVSIKVPKGDKEYTIRILSGSYADDMVLESRERVSSKTTINKEIEFRGVQNNWYKDWF